MVFLKKIIMFSLILAVCGLVVTPNSLATDGGKLRIGFVFVSPVGEEGWSYAHNQGRLALDNAFPFVKTTMLESVAEGSEAEAAFLKMVQDGYDVIIGTSHGYDETLWKLSAEFPETTFLNCSGSKHRSNLTGYFGRMYQARYLTGIVAGAMTKNNEIGYVAAFPTAEVIRGINAFTLGARSVNPEATVRVVWTKTWYNPAVEKKVAEGLLDWGVDIMAQHQDSAASQEVAQARGVYSIGYNTDMASKAPGSHLTAAIWDWNIFYKDFIRAFRYGRWKNGSFWYGMDSGLVDLAPYGDMVPEDVRQAVEEKKADIINGAFHVFSGPIRDQKGQVRIAAGKDMTDQQMLAMNWFVEGVIGTTE